eukprot:3119836-Karenia_brevis.AAC.1
MHTNLAALWTDALLRPFYKPSDTTEDARPVTCSEALLKFAVGCGVVGARSKFADVLGDEQYGAGRCAGAPALVRDVRAIARLCPARAITQVDFKNAFGRVEWNDAMGEIVNHVPALAPLTACMWGDRHQRLF